MEKKQSSIEWLEWQINLGLSERGLISAFKEAKAMHKEEVEDAYQKGRFNGQTNWGYGNDITAEQYYNETFGGTTGVIGVDYIHLTNTSGTNHLSHINPLTDKLTNGGDNE